MFEGMLGRVLNGAVWGLGAGLVLNVLRGGASGATESTGGPRRPAVRPLTKALMKAYVAVEERVRKTAAEARENVEDLYAEVKTEREADAADVSERRGPVAIPVEQGAASKSSSRSRRRRASA
jgi:hypothetical protein